MSFDTGYLTYRTFCYHDSHTQLRGSVGPVTFSKTWCDCPSVNFYVFFKGRLLPSPPPDCSLHLKALFFTPPTLWALSFSSGLFPSWPRILSPTVWLLPPIFRSFRSLISDSSLVLAAGSQSSALLLIILLTTTPYLYRFHRKPAISKFDRPFTPIHKSSLYFATH